jgi:hypothetical protein
MEQTKREAQIVSLKLLQARIATFHRILVSSAPVQSDESKLSPQILSFFETFRYTDPVLSGFLDESIALLIKDLPRLLPQFVINVPGLTAVSERDFRASAFGLILPTPKDIFGRACCQWNANAVLADSFQMILAKLPKSSIDLYTFCYSQLKRNSPTF